MKNVNRIKAALDKAYPTKKDKAAHFNVRSHDVGKKTNTMENKVKWIEAFIKPLGLKLEISKRK